MRKLLILIMAVLSMAGCHKRSDNPTLPQPPKDTIPTPPVVDTVPQTHVYISGYEIRKAFYWKDSTIVYLSDGQTSNSTTSIFVKDTDVYVGGGGEPARGLTFAAKYWKNGVPVLLTDGSRYGIVNDLYVDDKNNVYACGWEQSAAGYNDMHWIAKYWVNGKEFILSDSTVSDGVATAITADKQGNVYIAWWQSNAGGQRLGYYNKNGVKHLLNKKDFNLYPYDIAAVDADIYVTGFTDNGYDKQYGGYWKNGKLVIIDSLRSAWPILGTYKEHTIYLLGRWDRDKDYLWQDGNMQLLTIDPSGMFVHKDDVYISGTVYAPSIDYFVPGISIRTKDGIIQRELPLDKNMQSPVASGIFVQ